MVRFTGLEDKEVVLTERAGPKISDLLVNVARPVLDQVDTIEKMRRAIDLAALAWNLTVLPEAERRDEIERSARELCPDDPGARETGKQILTALVARKLALYPDVNRAIASYDVAATDEGIHVQVASFVLPDKP